MEVAFAILFAMLLTNVYGVKKCRSNCNEVYTPVCGHDPRLGYNTFCSLEALDKCNLGRGNNYTKIADGPCYPSVREWRTQSQSTTPEQETIKSRTLSVQNTTTKDPYLRRPDTG